MYLTILGAYVLLTVGICSLLACRGRHRQAKKSRELDADREDPPAGTEL